MDIYTAIAEPTRRNILEVLAEKGELSATDISHEFTITPSAISQHLKVLRESNVIKMKKNKQQRLYQINPDSFQELEEWAKKLAHVWNERFNALDKLLQEEKEKATRGT